MDILSQYNVDFFKSLLDNEAISEIVAPVIFDPSAVRYAQAVAGIHEKVLAEARRSLVTALEQADLQFRKSDDRTQRYYVKQTRSRTISTLFGDITYRRTEYRDRSTGKPFIYVDEKIGLFRRERYDPVVCSLLYEQYSNCNSMIKAGQNIGDMIHPFTICDDRSSNWIPRQSVWKILNRLENVRPPVPVMEKTPENLFIMADEKYIPLQREDKSEDDTDSFKGHIKAETRMAEVITGRTRRMRRDGEFRKRWELTGKYILAYPEDSRNFWDHALEDIDRMYDLSKIQNIYIMGDGAAWIRSGVEALKMPMCTIKYAADRYHIDKYISKITDDGENRKLLKNYANTGMTRDFRKLSESLKENRRCSEDAFDQAVDYVIAQIPALKVMNTEVVFGCSMEQAIQHTYASVFTSVPKAYGREHLPNYVIARVAHENGVNMRLLYLNAQDEYTRTGNSSPDFRKEEYDLSLFDSPKTDPYYHLSLSDHKTLRETTKK